MGRNLSLDQFLILLECRNKELEAKEKKKAYDQEGEKSWSRSPGKGVGANLEGLIGPETREPNKRNRNIPVGVFHG
jgi:hypothetical protein